MAIERREPEPGGPLDDRRLSALLGSLPRERARIGFASRVAARLDDPPGRPRSRVGRLRIAAVAGVAAGLAILVAGISLYRVSEEHRQERRIAEVRRALSEIRDEHRALAAEIERLPAAGSEPHVVYLGGDDQADYFVDLSRVDEPKTDPPVPAALRERS